LTRPDPSTLRGRAPRDPVSGLGHISIYLSALWIDILHTYLPAPIPWTLQVGALLVMQRAG